MAKEGGNSPWGQAALAVGSTAVNAITRGGPKRQFKYNKKLAEYQNELNRANAEWAFEKELMLRNQQREYDSPISQMQRFKAAGLNPNLIYGSGSASSGSVGSTHFPQVPGVNVGAIDAASMGALGTEFQQARLMAAQTDLTKVKTDESSYRAELIQAQKDLARANPYLQEGYVQSLVAQLKATASLKEQESHFMLSPARDKDGNSYSSRGFEKMQAELELLQQRFNLGELDKKVKAEVIQSKEFRNALDQIQVNWMKDGEITSQHIYQGIFMLLQSLMR